MFPPTAAVLAVSWRKWYVLLLIGHEGPVDVDASRGNFPPTATVLEQKR